MSKLVKIDTEYASWIKDLSLRFRQSQIKAAVRVNHEMLRFYWSVGEDIVRKQAFTKWGDKLFSYLSQDLQSELPGIKGLSVRNLQYMRQLYTVFSPLQTFAPQVVAQTSEAVNGEIAPQVVAQTVVDEICSIPWGHLRYILDKGFDAEKSLFYVRGVIKNNWSRSVLLNFLDTNLYERQGKAITNFQATLPAIKGDLAQQLLKDPYCFDFAGLTERYTEKELKDALIKNVEKFLLELGNGFAYMGREYRIEVGESELFADMLFYNTYLHCYVVVEVKTEKFENAFLGQLNGYVSCANHVLRREGDNPTVGLLICKDKDNVMAQYALEGYNNPLGISEYELSRLYPKDFKCTLPSIEDIERELKD